MTEAVREIWTARDDRALRGLLRAVEDDDLLTALLFVERATPEDAALARERLDAWASRVTARVASPEPDDAYVALSEVLVGQLGLEGDRSEYYGPFNSHLTNVLERRKGLPILLSAVWILVGRIAGLEMDGVGLPGHFIARVGGLQGVCIDPFDRGAALSTADCRRLVVQAAGEKVGWDDAWLAPVGTDALVERVLRNLVNAYARAQDAESLYRTVRVLATFRPADADAQLLHARMTEEMGAWRMAEPMYEAVMRQFPGSRAAGQAETQLGKLREGERYLN